MDPVCMGLMPRQWSADSGINSCCFEEMLDPSVLPQPAGAGAGPLCARIGRPPGPGRRWPGLLEPERGPGPGGVDP